MGNDDEKVLSQADVDALVALVPDTPRTEPTVTAKAVPEDKPLQPATSEPVRTNAPAHEPLSSTGSPSEIIAIQKTLADMTRQVSKLANTAQRLDLLEETIWQLEKQMQQSPYSIRSSGEQIAKIHDRVQELSFDLKKRHELREYFQCEHCDSKGTVAFLTKCTSCGQERWFGWWPGKKAVKNEPRKKSE